MDTVLKNLGIKRDFVVHGKGILGEMSITGKTRATEVKNGATKNFFIKPEDFGMKRGKLSEIKSGTREQNAEIIAEVLKGRRGPRRDITVLNATAAFVIAGRAKDFDQGVELAVQSIDSRDASNTSEKLVEFTNEESRY